MRIFMMAMLCFFAAPALSQTTFFSETFDAVTEPVLPVSAFSADDSWETSDASSSPGSGLNNAAHTGSSPGFLVLGPINLSAALDGTFSYWARRTSSYSADSLFVRAGTDGVTFGELLFGGGLPAASSSWEEISVSLPAALLGENVVYLQFEGRGGSSSGSNMRVDDVLIEGTADPSAIGTSFGFALDDIEWDLSGPVLDVNLDLEFPGPDSLQGFQFDLTWDDAVISVDSVSLGGSAGPSSDWLLSSSFGAGSGSVALAHLTALPPGPYSGVLLLHASAIGSPGISIASTLSVTGLLATLNSPTADELSLPDGHRSLDLTLLPSVASAEFSSTSLDFGLVAAGDSALVQMTVSNPTGNAPLVLSVIAPGPTPLNPVPTLPSSIPVGESGTLDLWLKPRFDEGGWHSGTITIAHNTASASTDLSWVAVVTGGRGDADGDGAFDVADVVVSLDGTVDPSAVPPAELPRHDVHPFPDGDGALDIRDITVAIQSILRDQWPDGSPLPNPPAGAAGKGAAIPLVLTRDSLWVASPVALRGIQIELQASTGFAVAAKGGTASSWSDPETGVHRLISLAGADAVVGAGYHLVAVFESELFSTDSPMPPESDFDASISFSTGMIVDMHGSKIPLSLQVAEELPDIPDTERHELDIYPNPLPLGRDLNLALPPIAITDIVLYDSIGRVAWKHSGPTRSIQGAAFRVPGTYFVRLDTNQGWITQSVVVVR